MVFRNTIKYSGHFLQQRRTVGTQAQQIVLGANKKRIFSVGVFLLGGSIAGWLYYFPLEPRRFFHHTRWLGSYRDKSELKENEEDKTFPHGKNFERFPTQVKYTEGEIFLDEKTIRSHLSAIGFSEGDVNQILDEKKLQKKKLLISEIMEELVEKYKKTSIRKLNKMIKIKNQKTMVVERTSDADLSEKLQNPYYVYKKDREALVFGKEEKQVKIISRLEVESSPRHILMEPEVTHKICTSLFALFAGSACVFAFKRSCRLHSDIFLSPIAKNKRFGKVFGATVTSVIKGAVYTFPFYTILLAITTMNNNVRKDEKYYRDGYADILPPTSSPDSLPAEGSDSVRMVICHSHLKEVTKSENTMECTTTLSTVSTSPLPPAHDPSNLNNLKFDVKEYTGLVLLGAASFAFAFPFTILPASCVGGIVLASLLFY